MDKKSFANPASFKQSFEYRLKQFCKDTGASPHRARQLFIYERFLVRIFENWGDKAVLKGGVLLELRLDRARATKDVDLSFRGKQDDLLRRLQEAGRLAMEDFLQFEVMSDLKHPTLQGEGMKYEGYRFRVQAFLGGKVYGSRFGLDAALSDFRGIPEQLEVESLLNFVGAENPVFNVYPLEYHLAEKIHAYVMPRDRPNSRVKDLPDMALIGTLRELKLESIRESLEQTFQSRDVCPIPKHLPAPAEHWGPVYEKMAKSNELVWSSLDEVYTAAQAFIDPILAHETGTWKPDDWSWC